MVGDHDPVLRRRGWGEESTILGKHRYGARPETGVQTYFVNSLPFGVKISTF